MPIAVFKITLTINVKVCSGNGNTTTVIEIKGAREKRYVADISGER